MSFMRAILGGVLILLAAASTANAQVNGGTFNGRVLDQGDAVLPGVTVTATNVSTGVVRTTVTNADGSYYLPALDPGAYSIKTELPGFSPATRDRVALGVNSTITLDFKMQVASLNETVTVTGDAPIIEVTQSKVASTIEAEQLESLPMITRSVSGMLALLPGAAPLDPVHRSKENVGSVAYAGGSGTNMTASVDGADNRDNRYGGPLLAYTTESLEQFQLATSQFSATDGRTGGAALTMVTKSGTNELHGSGFIFDRDRRMTAKDYFTKQSGGDKVPFKRQQFGGSLGGPIVHNRAFFFGALEQVYEDTSQPVPDRQFVELEQLVAATNAGLIPKGLVNPNHGHFGPIPGEITLYTLKTNAQINNAHSVMARFAGQRDDRDAVTFSASNDLREPENSTIRMWSAVGQHNWVLGNSGLNQITGQVNHMYRLSDVTSVVTGEHYTRDFPRVPVFPPRLSFPTVNTGAGGAGGSLTNTYVVQIKDDVSLLSGNHALKFGANFNALPNLGLLNANEHFPTLTFFDDPSVIVSNSNGRYPQGFQTPGIVRQWQQANPVRSEDINYGAKQFMTWFQDDWRATARLTLNLGVRYDLDLNFYDQRNYAQNATRLALQAIGNTSYVDIPKTPMKDISPRVGFAWDLTGNGNRVLRGGYGLYFDQFNTGGAGDVSSQNKRPLNALATLTNTSYGVGQLATYRFTVDPLPAQPTDTNSLPRGAAGQWLAPDLTDPQNHVVHVGYAHQLTATTALSFDYTHSEIRHDLRSLNINPLVNGRRVMADAFQRVFGIPDVLNAVNIKSSINKARYDALTMKFQRRLGRATIQAHYTIAGSYAYGGSTGSRGGASVPQDAFDPLARGEWGPTGSDERQRVVAMGVFDTVYGIQFSPVFQAATARPYNLTAGVDLNADGNNNDRYIDPATGKQVSINSARGDNTVVLDLRTTKFFTFSGERKIGVFIEAFNLFNTANFGGSFTGSARSTNFRKPSGGFIPGIGYARQLQLGARFSF